MERPETMEPEYDNNDNKDNNNISENDSFNIKEYELNLNNDIYKLQIENSSLKILFKLRPINNITTYYYLKEYKYEDIIKELKLSKKQYNNLTNIEEFIDKSLTNKNVNLIEDNKNTMKLCIKTKEDSKKEEEKFLYLKKEKISNKEILNILIDEINEMKNIKKGLLTEKEKEKKEEKKEKEKKEDININNLVDKMKKLNEDIIIKYKEKEELAYNIKLLSNKKNVNKTQNQKYKNEILLQIKNNLNNNFLSRDDEVSKDINESNIDLFINNVKYDFRKNLDYEDSIFKEGELYFIKIKFKNKINDCKKMFKNCKNIVNIDLSSFDTKNVIDMSEMFSGCSGLVNIDLSSFDTKNVTNISYMFSGCTNLINVDLSSFDTKNVTNMSNMFSGCTKLINIDLSSFDTKNVTNMSYMLSDCTNLINVDLSSFNIINAENLNKMFYCCKTMINIDLSSFDTKNYNSGGYFSFKPYREMKDLFYGCVNLKKVKINKKSLDDFEKNVDSDIIEF